MAREIPLDVLRRPFPFADMQIALDMAVDERGDQEGEQGKGQKAGKEEMPQTGVGQAVIAGDGRPVRKPFQHQPGLIIIGAIASPI